MKGKRHLTWAVLAAIAGMSFAGEAYAAENAAAGKAAAKTTQVQEQSAETAENGGHDLPDTLVTAQRRRKSELDTPATTTIITAKDIEKAGYRNVFEAIDQQIGSTSTSYGEAGQDFGFAAGRITLRGYDRGTLVMVNGVPMNLKNYPSTENIPAAMVERIEIVKGAASTLYGGEAMGGVINIILKKPKAGEEAVKASVTAGNYFKKTEVFFQGDRFMLDVSREWSKHIPHSNAFGFEKVSWMDWWVGSGQKNRLNASVALTDELSLNYNYTESTITRGSTVYKLASDKKSLVPSGTRYDYRYDDYRHTANLVYQGRENGIHAVLGYNYRKVDGYDYVAMGKNASNAVWNSEIFDVQKTWKLGDDSWIFGYSYQREAVDLTEKKQNATRTENAIYTSYSKQFTPRFNFTLGLRGEWINDPEKDQNVFMPQFQTDYKFDGNTAWYINVGRAFQMPPADYGINEKVRGRHLNPQGLQPESGWTYETGIKHRHGNDTWKAAIYHMDMKNKLGWELNKVTQQYYAANKGSFRNTGFEVEYTKRFNEAWQLVLGAGVSNPELKDPSGNKGWEQAAGRVEGLVRVDYKKDKWQGNLNFKFLGDREYVAPRNGTAQDIPDKIQLNMNIAYAAGRNDTVTLGIYNLLDRKNYSNSSGSLDLPLNFRLTYAHTF